jgi:hypothetical protein
MVRKASGPFGSSAAPRHLSDVVYRPATVVTLMTRIKRPA